MNKDRYNSLPDNLKAVIDANSGLEFSASAGKQMQADDAGPMKATQDRGNNVISLTPDQVAEWKGAADKTIKDWVAEMDTKGLDGSSLLEKARKLIADNTK